jgi:hypothetical protein
MAQELIPRPGPDTFSAMCRLPLLLVALGLASCGSSEPKSEAPPARTVTGPAPTAPSTPTTPTTATPAACVNLAATPAVKATLLSVHRGNDPRATGPKPGSTYYGRCGSTYYALASFRNANTGYDDQPEAFSRTSGSWRDLGDTGGPIEDNCGRIPPRLMARWGFKCGGG